MSQTALKRTFICISSSSSESEEEEVSDDDELDDDGEEEEVSDDDELDDDGEEEESDQNSSIDGGGDEEDSDHQDSSDDEKEEDESDENQGFNDESLSDAVVRLLRDGKDLGVLTLHECKAYLRKHRLRITGNKSICLQRIKEHWRIKDNNGETLYPRSSFVINCTGDVCRGDIVLFKQKVYKFDNVRRRGCQKGNRTVAGRVVKESYGADRQQHTFTIEVLWSYGVEKLPPLSPLLVKGRNLYRLKTFRRRWENEAERSIVLNEKHKRGAAARLVRDRKKMNLTRFKSQGSKRRKHGTGPSQARILQEKTESSDRHGRTFITGNDRSICPSQRPMSMGLTISKHIRNTRPASSSQRRPKQSFPNEKKAPALPLQSRSHLPVNVRDYLPEFHHHAAANFPNYELAPNTATIRGQCYRPNAAPSFTPTPLSHHAYPHHTNLNFANGPPLRNQYQFLPSVHGDRQAHFYRTGRYF